MVCYRRHGHNEGDDPKFTQPKLYNMIKGHKNPRELYLAELIRLGDITQDLAEEMEKTFWNDLQKRLDQVKEKPLPYNYQEPELAWKSLKRTKDPSDFEVSPDTGIKSQISKKIITHLEKLPEDFKILTKINRIQKGKKALTAENKIDWGLGELLAYGSILLEGKDVRMSGQDVKRGTFSHRHAVFLDTESDKEYNRLNEIEKKQGKFRIYNSLLSEFAVLGFEYGYSLATPSSLVVWEAQFGDFYNGAQTIVDQYITAAESKWQRMSGLVMLLPHGYAGQGPEHSSARVERFLQSCAEYNISVMNITTPANFFHAIRRQMERPFRKPMVVMSPKSLLRHPRCTSDISEIQEGTKFQEVLDDTSANSKKIKKVLLCTGKVYYDLLKAKEEQKRDDIAIIRVEQLYPFPLKQVENLLKQYAGADVAWVQEEPKNMGAWLHILANLHPLNITCVSRKPSASPATGYKKVHDDEQAKIIEQAFG